MAVVLCLGLSACGGEDDDSSGGGSPVFDGGNPPGGGGSPPPAGDDFGDSIDSATPISPGDNRSGNLTRYDHDYFRVALDRPGRLQVYTSGPTDTVGRVVDRFGRVLAQNDDGGDRLNFRIERDVSPNTWYIHVRGNSGALGPYTLHVRFTASSPGGGDGGTPPGDDHGDTRTDATRIAVDTNSSIEITTDGALTAGDSDYFRITLDRAGTLLVYTSGSTDTTGRLQDSSGSELVRNEAGGLVRNFRIERDVSSGTYYVRVTGNSRNTAGSYTLHVRFTADQLVGASGDVRVNLTWHADVDLDLFVTNPCDQILGYQEGSTNTCQGYVGEWDYDDVGNGVQQDNPNGENIVWTDGGPQGRYAVHVNYFFGSAPADYTVRIFYGSQQRTYNGRLDPTNDYRVRRHVADFQLSGSSSSQSTEESRFEAGSQALSRAARSLGVSAVAAMSSRGQAQDGSSLTLAGHPVSLGNGAASSAAPADDLSFAGKDPDWEGLDGSERSGTWSEFLHGSRFDVAVGEETRVWGEAHGTEGSNESRFLGFERSLGRGLVAGVAFSDTANEGNFGLAETESLQASLTSAYQYLNFSPGASTELWSLMGTGQGELSLTDDIGTVATDLSMQMFAFGSSHGLAPLVAGFAPTVSADGFLVHLESEGRAGLRSLAGEASRLRTGVLFERPPEGDGWTPKIGFGVRHEDDERGEATRTEVMAGFGYVRDRLRVEGMTYYWPTGSGEAESAEAGLRNRGSGARLTAHYRAAPDGRGLAVSVDALAGSVPDTPVWESDKEADGDSSARLQAGYGFASGLGRWMPYGELQLDGDEQHLREGVRHDIGAVSLDLFGEHRLGATSEHGIHIGLTAGF